MAPQYLSEKINMKKFGLKSLSFLGTSIILMIFHFIFLDADEIVRDILFYGSIICFIISFVLCIIGLIKDKKKMYSIISLILMILIILYVYFYINNIVPQETYSMLKNWL